VAETSEVWRAALQHLQQGRAQEALALLQPAAASEPNVFENRLYLGLALAGTGQLQASAAELQAALALNPSSAMAHYHMGAVCQGLGDNQPAAGWYRRAVGLQPNYPEAQQALAAIEAAAAPVAPVAPAAPGAPRAAPQARAPGPRGPAPSYPMPKGRKASRGGKVAAAIVLLLILGGGGGAALWYYVLGGAEKRAVQEAVEVFLEAEKGQDFYALQDLVVSRDQPLTGRFASARESGPMASVQNALKLMDSFDGVPDQASYTIDAIEIEGEKATVTVTLVQLPVVFCGEDDTVVGPGSLQQSDGQLPLKLEKEEGLWKIDMKAGYEAQQARYSGSFGSLGGGEDLSGEMPAGEDGGDFWEE